MGAFSNNVYVLLIIIGVGVGLGFGLIYVPAIVSVTNYFEKYRSLATGIAVCGSGFGTVIFSPLIDILIDKFDWRGAMIVLSIIVLFCVVFGIMFRPLVAPEHQPMIDVAANSNNIDKFTLNNNNELILSRSHSIEEVIY